MLSIWPRNSVPAHRRYVVRTMAFMGGYTLVNVATIFGAFDSIQGKPAAWALAAVVTAPVIGQLWATLSLMNESDEFMRALTAKQFILSTFLAFAIATLWGFGETYAGAPHIPAWMIYPLFWGCFGVVSPFVRSSK
ncbi:MAG: hypothetical protein EON89_04370 [Brevundimonas sp.]|nr:MAG: hypothetical protein EON89_04370 [Brevundimonas sp.]